MIGSAGPGPRRAATGYPRFLIGAVGIALAVGALGWLPALQVGGAAAVPALWAGCGVALVAAAVGALPVALSTPEPIRWPQVILLGTVIRLAVAAALGFAAIESGWFANRPLVIGAAATYAGHLVLEARYGMRAAQAAADGSKQAGDGRT